MFGARRVEPGTAALLPDDAPAWVTAPPDFSSSTHRFVVGSHASDDRDEVDRSLDPALVAAVQEYILEQVIQDSRERPRARFGALRGIRAHVDADYIRKNLIDDPEGYVGQLNVASTPLYQKWVTVSVTPTQREQIRAWHRQGVQVERLLGVGLVLLVVLAVVGLASLILRPRRFADRNAASERPAAPRRWGGWLLVGAAMLAMLIAAGFSLTAVRVQTAVEVESAHREQQARKREAEAEYNRAVNQRDRDAQKRAVSAATR